MRVRFAALAGMLLALGVVSSASAQSYPGPYSNTGNYTYDGYSWQGFGADMYPAQIIVINSAGAASLVATGQGTYDQVEDTYVGVINNYSGPISSLALTGALGEDIFGFDGDGVDTYGATGLNPVPNYESSPPLWLPNAKDTSYGGYGGANAYFTNINTSTLYTTGETGIVNFITPIAPGGNSYFSLEENLTSADFSVPHINPSVPEPTSILAWSLLGGLGMVWQWRRSRKAV